MDTDFPQKKLKKKARLKPIGWREWVALPALGIHHIKAKIDTGARTSALHAFELRIFNENGKDKIAFDIHPLQNNVDVVISCTADIIDKRWVTDSGGHREERYVISTPIVLGDKTWPIEITLTERDTMLFRMLLGRSAIRKRFVVNPGRSFIKNKE
ncbi:MAG TPA: ATP-dependent zinc protease [Gammaproteobacteria bacterium]|nr:ATP-dependent zinc protease [Gammaproteobacteria bacterium]